MCVRDLFYDNRSPVKAAGGAVHHDPSYAHEAAADLFSNKLFSRADQKNRKVLLAKLFVQTSGPWPFEVASELIT